ncbi:MAG: hypothetical protein QXP04_00300 [Candidatus Nanoarchaeia archaeon]
MNDANKILSEGKNLPFNEVVKNFKILMLNYMKTDFPQIAKLVTEDCDVGRKVEVKNPVIEGDNFKFYVYVYDYGEGIWYPISIVPFTYVAYAPIDTSLNLVDNKVYYDIMDNFKTNCYYMVMGKSDGIITNTPPPKPSPTPITTTTVTATQTITQTASTTITQPSTTIYTHTTTITVYEGNVKKGFSLTQFAFGGMLTAVGIVLRFRRKEAP